MILWFRLPACLLICGVIAALERPAPPEGAALSRLDSNCASEEIAILPRSRPQGAERGRRDDGEKPLATSVKVAWTLAKKPKSLDSRVDVSGVDPAMLSVLAKAPMTQALWTSFFSVHVLSDAKPGATDVPPVWGRYHTEEKLIQFVPRFPPEAGVRYRAVFDPARLRSVVRELAPALAITEPKTPESPLTADLFFTKRIESTTKITVIYPSGEQVPENLLRLYIHFSAPMSRGEAYRHLKLIDLGTSKPVHAPFLELEEELWSPDGKRFTLLIDPGRIKRGLKPREMFGPVLESGKTYRLVVDRDWIDAEGNPLEADFRRTFRAGPPDESLPDPKKWALNPPEAGTRSPLEARFSEPLDHALIERLIAVRDPENHPVSGRITVADAETLWRFIPEAPWRSGTYRLTVGTELEDVAGNSVGSPFEVDLTSPITNRVSSDRVQIPFDTRRPKRPDR